MHFHFSKTYRRVRRLSFRGFSWPKVSNYSTALDTRTLNRLWSSVCLVALAKIHFEVTVLQIVLLLQFSSLGRKQQLIEFSCVISYFLTYFTLMIVSYSNAFRSCSCFGPDRLSEIHSPRSSVQSLVPSLSLATDQLLKPRLKYPFINIIAHCKRQFESHSWRILSKHSTIYRIT